MKKQCIGLLVGESSVVMSAEEPEKISGKSNYCHMESNDNAVITYEYTIQTVSIQKTILGSYGPVDDADICVRKGMVTVTRSYACSGAAGSQLPQRPASCMKNVSCAFHGKGCPSI